MTRFDAQPVVVNADSHAANVDAEAVGSREAKTVVLDENVCNTRLSVPAVAKPRLCHLLLVMIARSIVLTVSRLCVRRRKACNGQVC